MPPSKSAAKKQPLTLAQVSLYDDILTDALVDHVYYWTTIPKNRPSYHASRGLREEEITKIVQSHLIVDPDVNVAESKLLATEGLRKFYDGLKTPKEKDDFRGHLRRYFQIYLPDCPFEVSSTNRYTIVTHEARVTARRCIRKGQPVKYLCGIQVPLTAKEEEDMTLRKKDFSIVVSSRSKCASLFMGPARFANHDCDANARLMITGQSGIEIIATRDIEIGDEITVTYGDNYFGEANCECLCQTCEDHQVNGWAPADGTAPVERSIEDSAAAEGYSLRRRRREASTASSSRTPSVAPEIRPRVLKTRSKTLKTDSSSTTTTVSPAPENLLRQKRKRELDSLKTPPVTPSKRVKTAQYNDVHHITSPLGAHATTPSSASDCGSSEQMETDVTTPDEDMQEPKLHVSTQNSQNMVLSTMKHEDSDTAALDTITATPLPTIETIPQSGRTTKPPPATGVPHDESCGADIVLPPPITPVSQRIDAPITPSTVESPFSVSDKPKRGRGGFRGRRKGAVASRSVSPARRIRTPKDYTLTPLLLSEPNTAWIYCMNCSEAFVQQNAYYTRSSCPRCERHSKLYGYMWPKTEREGIHDKEERILDHRTIHRFLHADDEAWIRGRKRPDASSSTPAVELAAEDESTDQQPVKRGRGRPKKQSSSLMNHYDDYDHATATPDGDDVRRSGRRRHPSTKAAA